MWWQLLPYLIKCIHSRKQMLRKVKMVERILIINKVYFCQSSHFSRMKIFGIWILGVVIICVGKNKLFFYFRWNNKIYCKSWKQCKPYCFRKKKDKSLSDWMMVLKILSHVFYALGLPHNLLSMGRTIVCQRTQHADLLLTCQGKDDSQPSISFENSSRKTFLLEFCDSKWWWAVASCFFYFSFLFFIFSNLPC